MIQEVSRDNRRRSSVEGEHPRLKRESEEQIWRARRNFGPKSTLDSSQYFVIDVRVEDASDGHDVEGRVGNRKTGAHYRIKVFDPGQVSGKNAQAVDFRARFPFPEEPDDVALADPSS